MKKKGLIISTVVMVIVLIASLTTATYAWFSTTATATVNEMTVNTAASEGLTIAKFGYNGSNAEYVYGDLALKESTGVKGVPGVWEGTNYGTGSNVAFDTKDMSTWGVTGNGFAMLTSGEESGSTSGSEAVNLYKATENKDYFSTVLYLETTKTTDTAEDVYANITFKATGAMAASAKIGVYTFNGTGEPADTDLNDATKWDVKYILAPYGKATKTGPNWYNTSTTATAKTYLEANTAPTDYTTAVAKTATTQKNLTNVIVDETPFPSDLATEGSNDTANKTSIGQLQTQGTGLYVKLVIWFDGEEDECIPNNAGTGITVKIEFTKGTQGA